MHAARDREEAPGSDNKDGLAEGQGEGAERVLWFNTSQQLSTTQPFAHSPTSRMWERIGRVKVRKLVG